MSVRTLLNLAVVGLAMGMLGGCSEDQGEPRHPVSGTVRLNGKPVEGAIVAFTPQAGGKPASGTTDASGVYKLTTTVSGDGAVAGQYMVSVAKYQTTLDSPVPPPETTESQENADPYDITNEYPTGYDELEESEIAASVSKNLLPPKYAIPQRSGLTATVTEGPNTFDFDLK